MSNDTETENNNSELSFKEDSDIKQFFNMNRSYLDRANSLNIEGAQNIKKLENFTTSLVNHYINWTQAKGYYNVDKQSYCLKYEIDGDMVDLELGSLAFNQICQSRTTPLRGRYLESLPQPFRYINPHGEAMDLDLRTALFNEVFTTRTADYQRYLREVNKSVFQPNQSGSFVVGVVGRNYPIDFSDFKMVNSISNHLNDLGLKFSYRHNSISENGDISFSWNIHDRIGEKQVDINHLTGKQFAGFSLRQDRGVSDKTFNENLPTAGMYYYNNFAGGGSLHFSGYTYQQVCSNGMIGKAFSKLTERIEHMTLNSFVKKLVSDVFNWSDKQIANFKEYTGFDYTIPGRMDYTDFLLDGGIISDRLYDLISKNVIFKSIMASGKIQQKYLKSLSLIVEDWTKEVTQIALTHRMTDTQINELLNIGVNEPTIKLSLNDKEAEYTSIIDTFTSASNYYRDKGSLSRSLLYQEIAGNLLSASKPITQVITI